VADAAVLAERIHGALGRVLDPEIRRPVTELDMIGDVLVDEGGAATVSVKLTIVGCPAADTIERDVREATASVDGVTAVTVDVTVMTPTERHALTDKLRAGRAARGMQFGPETLTRVYAARAASASRRSPPTSPSRWRPAGSPSASSTPTSTASASLACSASSTPTGPRSSRPGSTT
jgi:metal-sulfur cluster biosynthetic enzyme